jgi:hypothetical protein
MKYPASVIRTNQCIWYHATGPKGLGIYNFNPDVGAPAPSDAPNAHAV